MEAGSINRRLDINLALSTLSINDADCMCVLPFGPRRTEDGDLHFGGEGNRKFVLRILALVALMQEALGSDEVSWVGLSAEEIWDCGGVLLGSICQPRHESRASFCGRGGLFDIWSQRLPNPTQRSCPYAFADLTEDANNLSHMAACAKTTERSYLKDIFRRESVTEDEAKQRGMRKRYVYGIGARWRVQIIDLDKLDPSVRQVYVDLPLHVPRIAKQRGVLPPGGWAIAHLKWAKEYPDLRPPEPYVEPSLSTTQRPSDYVRRLPRRKHDISQPPGALPDGTEIQHARDALRSSAPRIVLVGEPGSGMTAALLSRFQELRAVADGKRSVPVPVYVDLTGQSSVSADLVLAAIGPKPRGRVSTIEELDRPLVALFDGLHRMQVPPGAQIGQLARGLLSFTQHDLFKQVFLSCIECEWNDDYLRGVEAKVCHMHPWDVAPAGGVDQYVHATVPECSDPLMTAIREKGTWYASIAQNPRYLFFLCDSLREIQAGMPLPEISAGMIHAWIPRVVGSEPDRWFSSGGAQVLAGIAAVMVEKGIHAIHSDDLPTREMRLPQNWYEYARKACHCGLLSSFAYPGLGGVIRFANLPLREYFAARWLKEVLKGPQLEATIPPTTSHAWIVPFRMAGQLWFKEFHEDCMWKWLKAWFPSAEAYFQGIKEKRSTDPSPRIA